MKTAKTLLALALTLALTLTLALPAFAETDPSEEPDPAMPVITVQPEGVRVKFGRFVTLSVQANIPNGDEIGYQWYCGDTKLDGETGASIRFRAINIYQGSGDYRIEVFSLTNEACSITSELARVEIDKTVYMNILTFLLYLMPVGTLVALPLIALHEWFWNLIMKLDA